jgi:putative endonuclease
MFFIYILFSESAGKFYIGYSSDPIKRLVQHNTSPKTTFTSKFRPWVLKTYFPVSDSRSVALKVERFIKNQKDRDFILQLIRANGDPVQIAQLLARMQCRRG